VAIGEAQARFPAGALLRLAGRGDSCYEIRTLKRNDFGAMRWNETERDDWQWALSSATWAPIIKLKALHPGHGIQIRTCEVI